jgi:hypothetical protein
MHNEPDILEDPCIAERQHIAAAREQRRVRARQNAGRPNWKRWRAF